MSIRTMSRLALASLIVLLVPRIGAQHSSRYHVVREYNVGGEGGWDYLSVDTAGHRLFVTRGDRVSAIDLATGKLLGEMHGLHRAHGVAFDYSHGHGFVTSGADSSVVMFDLATLKALGQTTAQVDADAILFDPFADRILTFNGDAGSATAIDPRTGKRIANIDLHGKPEYAVSDGRGRIYVNIADKSELVELDAKALTIVRRWSIKPCDDPSGLALDQAHARLFSVCGNKLMVISDAVHGRVVASVPIGSGVDAAAYDPKTGDAFASNGEGTMTVVHEDSPERFHVAQTITTMTGARTMIIDPMTHRLYTIGAKYGAKPAEATKDNPRRRAPLVPGSQTVVVIER